MDLETCLFIADGQTNTASDHVSAVIGGYNGKNSELYSSKFAV